MPFKSGAEQVHVVRPTADSLPGLNIGDPSLMQGCLVYVVESDSYYKLVLDNGEPINPPFIFATILGGESRWVLTNIANAQPPEPTMADYVIVGLGTAGAPLARYLSENMTTSVVVLEAGENRENDPLVQAGPPFGPIIGVNPRYSYVRASDPADINPGPEGTFPYSDGRLWGGGSSHNGMVSVRGTPDVWNEWGAINALWFYANVLPVMKFLETYTPNGTVANPAQRGSAGPLYISQDPPLDGNHFWADVASATAAPQISDYNDPDLGDVGTVAGQWFSSNLAGTGGGLQRRADAVTAFLPNTVVTPDGHGVGDRKLEIISKATVIEVMTEFTDGGFKATGVRYFLGDDPSTVFEIKANTKVILCAGSIGNPQLLQLSGIGPAAVLSPLGIPVNVPNDNVGRNMQNHYGPVMLLSEDTAAPLTQIMESYIDESATDPGPYAPHAGGYTFPASFGAGVRGTQLTTIPGNALILHSIITALFGSSPPAGISMVTFMVKSTERNGTVEIVSTDATLQPEIKWKFFQAPQDSPTDLERSVNLYKIGANIALQYSITKGGADLPVLYPPVDHFPAPYGPAPDDSLLESDAKDTFLIAAYHAVGTCRMSVDASTGVVDGELDVHGVQGLACADCSVIPAISTGNTAYPAYIIGLMKAKIEGAAVPF